eukprot:1200240-Amphidinium_carterae.1
MAIAKERAKVRESITKRLSRIVTKRRITSLLVPDACHAGLPRKTKAIVLPSALEWKKTSCKRLRQVYLTIH